MASREGILEASTCGAWRTCTTTQNTLRKLVLAHAEEATLCARVRASKTWNSPHNATCAPGLWPVGHASEGTHLQLARPRDGNRAGGLPSYRYNTSSAFAFAAWALLICASMHISWESGAESLGCYICVQLWRTLAPHLAELFSFPGPRHLFFCSSCTALRDGLIDSSACGGDSGRAGVCPARD